jgi:hypothetical protein
MNSNILLFYNKIEIIYILKKELKVIFFRDIIIQNEQHPKTRTAPIL